MEGAWQLLAALAFAQALSLPFGEYRPAVRLAVGLTLGLWILAPYRGFPSALLHSAAPLAAWAVFEFGVRRRRRMWKLAVASEAIYAALVVGWITLWAPLQRQDLLRLLDSAKTASALGIATVYLVAIFGGERLIRVAIAPFLADLPPADQRALPRAGRVIGWAERFVVMTLIAAGYGEPVGWLLAAKTAMRYPEIKEESTGRLGEYFFVGTLISISIGVVAGIVVRRLLT